MLKGGRMQANQHKCPQCGGKIQLIEKVEIKEKEYHLFRCPQCRKLFIEDNIENEKEVFDALLKNKNFTEEKLSYFIDYLTSKGRFTYAGEYLELSKEKFGRTPQLLMSELLISLRCRNENDLQFYIKNIKDADLLKELILSLEEDKQIKLAKYFLKMITNCANIFGGKDLLKCEAIFDAILSEVSDLSVFHEELINFSNVCKNKSFDELAKKYSSMAGEELKEKNYTLDHSILPEDKEPKVAEKPKRENKEKENKQSATQEKETQPKIEKDKVKKLSTKIDKAKKSKIVKIVLCALSLILVLAIVLLGAFYFKGDSSSKIDGTPGVTERENESLKKSIIFPVEGEYRVILDYGGGDLVLDNRQNSWVAHFGVDFSSLKSNSVFAVSDGSVTECTSVMKDGVALYKVVVDHGNNTYTMYENLMSISCENGKIKQGDEIGKYYGTYVHFAVKTNGSYINPHTYLNF